MDNFLESLEKEYQKVKKEKIYLEKQLSNMPEGRLEIRNFKQKYPQYYHVIGENRLYLDKNNYEMIKELAQKQYYESVQKLVNERFRLMERLLPKYKKDSIDAKFDRLSEQRRQLIQPLYLDDEEYIKEWRNHHLPEQNPYPLPEIYKTENGELVRSKTEILIADKYRTNHVPYIYETKIVMKDGATTYPDFMLLNIRLRKTYIHEHFGKMNDPEYAEKAVRKINQYIKNGYQVGKNIIFTFESTDNPFEKDLLDHIIYAYLK